jgi:hypothetical protein
LRRLLLLLLHEQRGDVTEVIIPTSRQGWCQLQSAARHIF